MVTGNHEGQGWHRSATPGSTPGSPRGHPSGHSGGDGLRGEPPPSGRHTRRPGQSLRYRRTLPGAKNGQQPTRSADTKTAPGSRPGSAQRKGVGT